MPFVKPGALYALQVAADRAENEGLDSIDLDSRELQGAMRICPVCGSASCDKKLVEANGVMVHPEDVAEAEELERP